MQVLVRGGHPKSVSKTMLGMGEGENWRMLLGVDKRECPEDTNREQCHYN
jgi:hypothetical protein